MWLGTFKVKRSKVKVTRPLYSPPCWRVRQLQRWAWERVGREKLLLRCRLLGRASRFGAHGGRSWAGAYRGGRPPTACFSRIFTLLLRQLGCLLWEREHSSVPDVLNLNQCVPPKFQRAVQRRCPASSVQCTCSGVSLQPCQLATSGSLSLPDSYSSRGSVRRFLSSTPCVCVCVCVCVTVTTSRWLWQRGRSYDAASAMKRGPALVTVIVVVVIIFCPPAQSL